MSAGRIPFDKEKYVIFGVPSDGACSVHAVAKFVYVVSNVAFTAQDVYKAARSKMNQQHCQASQDPLPATYTKFIRNFWKKTVGGQTYRDTVPPAYYNAPDWLWALFNVMDSLQGLPEGYIGDKLRLIKENTKKELIQQYLPCFRNEKVKQSILEETRPRRTLLDFPNEDGSIAEDMTLNLINPQITPADWIPLTLRENPLFRNPPVGFIHKDFHWAVAVFGEWIHKDYKLRNELPHLDQDDIEILEKELYFANLALLDRKLLPKNVDAVLRHNRENLSYPSANRGPGFKADAMEIILTAFEASASIPADIDNYHQLIQDVNSQELFVTQKLLFLMLQDEREASKKTDWIWWVCPQKKPDFKTYEYTGKFEIDEQTQWMFEMLKQNYRYVYCVGWLFSIAEDRQDWLRPEDHGRYEAFRTENIEFVAEAVRKYKQATKLNDLSLLAESPSSDPAQNPVGDAGGGKVRSQSTQPSSRFLEIVQNSEDFVGSMEEAIAEALEKDRQKDTAAKDRPSLFSIAEALEKERQKDTAAKDRPSPAEPVVFKSKQRAYENILTRVAEQLSSNPEQTFFQEIKASNDILTITAIWTEPIIPITDALGESYEDIEKLLTNETATPNDALFLDKVKRCLDITRKKENLLYDKPSFLEEEFEKLGKTIKKLETMLLDFDVHEDEVDLKNRDAVDKDWPRMTVRGSISRLRRDWQNNKYITEVYNARGNFQFNAPQRYLNGSITLDGIDEMVIHLPHPLEISTLSGDLYTVNWTPELITLRNHMVEKDDMPILNVGFILESDNSTDVVDPDRVNGKTLLRQMRHDPIRLSHNVSGKLTFEAFGVYPDSDTSEDDEAASEPSAIPAGGAFTLTKAAIQPLTEQPQTSDTDESPEGSSHPNTEAREGQISNEGADSPHSVPTTPTAQESPNPYQDSSLVNEIKIGDTVSVRVDNGEEIVDFIAVVSGDVGQCEDVTKSPAKVQSYREICVLHSQPVKSEGNATTEHTRAAQPIFISAIDLDTVVEPVQKITVQSEFVMPRVYDPTTQKPPDPNTDNTKKVVVLSYDTKSYSVVSIPEEQRGGTLHDIAYPRTGVRPLAMTLQYLLAKVKHNVEELNTIAEKANPQTRVVGNDGDVVLFPQLTDEVLKAVEDAWDDNKALDKVLSQFKTFSTKREDLITLSGTNWLNDNVINHYMEMINARVGSDDAIPKIWATNTHFYSTLKRDGYDRVSTWTKRLDKKIKGGTHVFALDKMIVPIHLGSHWACGVVNFRRKRFELHDSINPSEGVFFKHMRIYLHEESKDKKQPFDLKGWTNWKNYDCPKQVRVQCRPMLCRPSGTNGSTLLFSSPGALTVIGPWRYRSQNNGVDCGVFASQFANYSATSLDTRFPFGQVGVRCVVSLALG